MNNSERKKWVEEKKRSGKERIMREKLAELCHEQWSKWMKYLFSKGTFNEDGTWTMPKEFTDRWKRQMNTRYAELSEVEKESDRKEADKFIQLINDCDYAPSFLNSPDL